MTDSPKFSSEYNPFQARQGDLLFFNAPEHTHEDFLAKQGSSTDSAEDVANALHPTEPTYLASVGAQIPLNPDRSVTLAKGTATGHSHRAVGTGASAIALKDSSDILLSLPEGGQIVHDEHSTINMPAGSFTVRRQVEYTPSAIVQVED